MYVVAIFNADLRRALEAYGRPQEKNDCHLALDEGEPPKKYPEYETTLWSSNDMFVTLRTLASDPLSPEYLTSCIHRTSCYDMFCHDIRALFR